MQGKAALGVVYVPVTGDLFYRDLDGFSYVESGASRVERRGQIAQINCRAVEEQKIIAVKSADFTAIIFCSSTARQLICAICPRLSTRLAPLST